MSLFKKNNPANQNDGFINENQFDRFQYTAGTEQDSSSVNKMETENLEKEKREKMMADALEALEDYMADDGRDLMIQLGKKTIAMDELIESIEEKLTSYLTDHRISCSDEDFNEIVSRFQKKQFGYDIIEDYLDDDDVSDIKILGPSSIRIKVNGTRKSSPRHFKDKEDYLNFARRVALKNGINTGINNAIQVCTDKNSCSKAILRINYTSELINSSEMPYICFRKIPKEKRTLSYLTEQKHMMDKNIEAYLKKQAVEASGMLFTGKGASGKTTLMNALLDYIPLNKSGLVIQESEELFSEHPDIMFQHIIQTKGDGVINYSLGDLAVNGLLTDIDYFIIGEIKGEEAAKFMTAAYTGTQCWASVHGTTSQDAINKLADYVTWGTKYSLKDIYHMLRFMKVIVFMKDYKVWEISEVSGINEDGILEYKPIVKDGVWLGEKISV